MILTATPAPGSTFAGFTGDAVCPSGSITVLADYNCTATFSLIAQPTLTVVLAGAGTGRITSGPAGIDCGVDCSEAYTAGTVVTLTATVSGPDAANTMFAGFSGEGDCSDGAVTLNSDVACMATFDLIPQHSLTVALAGQRHGHRHQQSRPASAAARTAPRPTPPARS